MQSETREAARNKNKKMENKEEIFPIVDETGKTIGKATRGECHSGSKLLHPVVHLHVLNGAGQIFLQKRADDKIIQPGKWDTAVGGHMDYGEDVEKALRRETREEIGLTDFKAKKVLSYVFESKVERELVNTYITNDWKGEIKVDPEEISEGRFWSLKEVDENLGKGVFTPNFEQEFTRIKGKIEEMA